MATKTENVLSAAGAALLGAALAIGFMAGTAHAESYVEAGSGVAFGTQRSNSDGIEFGSEPGFTGTVTAGHTFLDSAVFLSAEITSQHHVHALHGQNGGNGNRTADGETLRLTVITVGVAAESQTPIAGLHVYARIGAGGAYANALGDGDLSPAATMSAGLRYDVTESLSVSGGYGALHVHGVSLKNSLGRHDGNLTMHGPEFRIRYTFGN